MAPPSLLPAAERRAVLLELRDAVEAVAFGTDDPERVYPENLRELVVRADRVIASDPGLAMTIDVRVVKTRRRRCPRCQRVRVLFRLVAHGESPFGEGPLLCGECGGLRG